MKRTIVLSIFAGLFFFNAYAEKSIPHAHRTCNENYNRRTEIILPQVNGYNIYKGDFHIHTSFSDARVSPAGRVDEAWRDGLDVIAITDHYEGRYGEKRMLKVLAPYNKDGKAIKYQSGFDANCIKADFNEIHQDAVDRRDKLGYEMTIIKGCEMARNSKTHGHFCCLFLEDINTVYDFDLKEAFKKVHKQGGLVVHNHPAWNRDTSAKTPFHEEVYSAGLIDGVEVANGYSFYPHIIRRCREEKLFMLGCTDVHGMTAHKYTDCGSFRTMTFIFAKENTEKAIKEALLKRRTIAYSGGELFGEEEWLKAYLNAAVECRILGENNDGKSCTYLLTNHTSITYRLRIGKVVHALEPFHSLQVKCTRDKESGKFETPKFTVDNMWQIDYQNLTIEFDIDK